MKQKIPPHDAVNKGPSLEEQLVQIMDGAREAVGVDRLHLWALAPEGDRLLYVAGSGPVSYTHLTLPTTPYV